MKHSCPGPATLPGPSPLLLRIRAGEQLRLGDPHHGAQHVPASAAEPGNNPPGPPAASKIAPFASKRPWAGQSSPGHLWAKGSPGLAGGWMARRKAARSSWSASTTRRCREEQARPCNALSRAKCYRHICEGCCTEEAGTSALGTHTSSPGVGYARLVQLQTTAWPHLFAKQSYDSIL